MISSTARWRSPASATATCWIERVFLVYQGDRVGFSSSSDNIGSFHQRAYRELASYRAPRSGPAEVESSGPAVRSFRCYVNPGQPEDAVLYRELRWEMQAFMAIFALTFPAVGGGVVAFGWVSFLRLRRERRLQEIHPGEPWRRLRQRAAVGAARLEMKTMPVGFLLVFNLVWTAAAVFLVRQQAPLIFQLIWSVSAAVIWGVICWQLLHRRTVTFGDGGLVVLNRLGPAQWRIDLSRDRIAGYSFDSNMQSNNRNFHRVRVEDIAGKQHTLASGISEAGKAEALTRHLETLGNG